MKHEHLSIFPIKNWLTIIWTLELDKQNLLLPIFTFFVCVL